MAAICEEFETHQDGSGEPDALMGQSIVLGEIKAEIPLDNDIPSHQNLLLQRYEERIEMRKTVDTLCSRFGNDCETFALLSLQTSSVCTEQWWRYVKSMKPFMKERRDPL